MELFAHFTEIHESRDVKSGSSFLGTNSVQRMIS